VGSIKWLKHISIVDSTREFPTSWARRSGTPGFLV
jgi:hypothetical protein